MARCACFLLLLFGAVPVFSQQPELTRLVAESTHVRSLAAKAPDLHDDRFNEIKRGDWTQLKKLLRDWVESRLPLNVDALDSEYPGLQARLLAELWRAGIVEPDKSDAAAGYISGLKLSRPVGYPASLLVEAAVTVPCGQDESIYLYRFTTSGRQLVVEADGRSPWGDHLAETEFSAPDVSGAGMFYASWFGVQCASVWNELDFRVYRIAPGSAGSLAILSDTHSFVIDGDSHVKITPEEFLLELTAGAMEGGFRRTYVLRYKLGVEGVERVDPVALQPQDFVHEWLIRPWSEMESRSSPGLTKWHKYLHADDAVGEYDFVQQCTERPGATQVAVYFHHVGKQEMPEPLSVYFLVLDKGDHRYEMSNISFNRQPGCPGESYATYDNAPSLFKKD